MKGKLNCTFSIILIIIRFSSITLAQNNGLPRVFEKYIQNKFQSLKDEWNDENKDARKVLYSDLNNDGLEDAVLQFQFLYSNVDYGNTVVSKIFFAVFLKGNNKYKLVDEIAFGGGNLQLPGLFSSIELVEMQKNIIKAKAYRYNVYDAHCCPSYTEEVEFKFVNNKLIPLQEIKDEKFVYPKIGDQIDFGEFYVKVDNVEYLNSIGDRYVNIEADGIFMLLDLIVTNHRNYPITIYSSFFEVKDDGINSYKVATNVLPYLELIKRKSLIVEEISPKIPKKISFIFEVPNISLYFLIGANRDFDLPSTICLVNSEKEYFKYKKD